MELDREETDKQLIKFLSTASSYRHDPSQVYHLETHISHVFLTGSFAYKIKKPRKLDFLDFSTLEKRRVYCQRELELNRRYAPELYLSVIPIYNRDGKYTFDQYGDPVEFALQMVQFETADLFSELLKADKLTADHLRRLVVKIVEFQDRAALKPSFWGVEQVARVAETNFAVCKQYVSEVIPVKLLEKTKELSEEAMSSISLLISQRQNSHVKELHGDLHLGNITLFKGEPTLFDGIEFNESYSCCDTWADIAFLIMDLCHKGRKDYATLVVNNYLERTDDFEGLMLLPFYLSYRAMVRAKVGCLLYENKIGSASELIKQEATSYLQLANDFLTKKQSKVFAIGGLSGSGKSTTAGYLSEKCGAVVIRSDAVRKHLSGVSLEESAPIAAYDSIFSGKVYQGMLKRADAAIQSGHDVIFDATYLEASEREAVAAWATTKELDFTGFWCEASPEVTRERLEQRKGDVSDADFEIYLLQREKDIGRLTWRIIHSPQETELSQSF